MSRMYKATMSGILAVILVVSMGLAQAYAGKQMILNLVGTGVATPGTVPDIDGDGIDDPADCFTVDLKDMTAGQSGQFVGTATDCLSDVTPVGGGLSLVGTTIFEMPQGQLVSRGLTTVQPTTHGSPDVTHITGAIPDGSNDVLSGTKKFKNAAGTVRLSGAVNMSKLASDGEITFDCIFVINLD